MNPGKPAKTSRADDGASRSKQSLRVWIRLLHNTRIIEKNVRSYLANEFGTTLPRFDALAALDRFPEGLTMGALSERLLVSNGNVTGVIARLQDEGLVLRTASKQDRRAFHVKLTRKGKRAFQEMAKGHEAYVNRMLEAISASDLNKLNTLLTRLEKTVAQERSCS